MKKENDPRSRCTRSLVCIDAGVLLCVDWPTLADTEENFFVVGILLVGDGGADQLCVLMLYGCGGDFHLTKPHHEPAALQLKVLLDPLEVVEQLEHVVGFKVGQPQRVSLGHQ